MWHTKYTYLNVTIKICLCTHTSEVQQNKKIGSWSNKPTYRLLYTLDFALWLHEYNLTFWFYLSGRQIYNVISFGRDLVLAVIATLNKQYLLGRFLDRHSNCSDCIVIVWNIVHLTATAIRMNGTHYVHARLSCAWVRYLHTEYCGYMTTNVIKSAQRRSTGALNVCVSWISCSAWGQNGHDVTISDADGQDEKHWP